MAQFIKILNTIMPPPAQPAPREFSGTEYRWKAVVFRPAYFKYEAIAFGALLAYLALHFLGRFVSNYRAKQAYVPGSVGLQEADKGLGSHHTSNCWRASLHRRNRWYRPPRPST